MGDIDYGVMRRKLRELIQFYLDEKRWTHVDVANVLDISRSGFTKMMNGSALFTLEVLDNLTREFGLPEGFFYDDFLGECIELRHNNKKKTIQPESDKKKRKVNRRDNIFLLPKCEKFIRRCLECRRDEIAVTVLDTLVAADAENRSIAFDIAEEIFETLEKKPTQDYEQVEYKQFLMLYNYYIESETDYQSEKLAISHFRIYYILRFNVHVAYNKLTVLLAFIKKLPLEERLKAYDRVMMYYYINMDWRNTVKFATITEDLAANINEDTYGHAVLVKSIALKELCEFDEAKMYTNIYKNISGFENLAYINSFNIEVSSGDLSRLEDYLNAIENVQHPESDLAIIVRKLNEADLTKKSLTIIERFSRKIVDDESNTLRVRHIMNLFYEMAVSFCKEGLFDLGIDYLCRSARKAIKLNRPDQLGKIMSCFENVRITLEQKHLDEFKKLLDDWNNFYNNK